MKSKRHRMSGVILTGVLVVLTGCGAGNTAGDRPQDTASGSAVSRIGKEHEEKAAVSRFANDDNSYQCDGIDLVQKKLDGTTVQKYTFKYLYSLDWVTNEWVYYKTHNQRDTVWRVPIQKSEHGDKLNFKKKEKLFCQTVGDVYVTDSYLLYCGDKDDEMDVSSLYRYDLQTKETTLLRTWKNDFTEQEYIDFLTSTEEEGPIVLNGFLFLQVEGSGLYCLNPETGSLKLIYSEQGDELSCPFPVARCGNDLYFSPNGQDIFRYVPGSEQAVLAAGADVLCKELETLSFGETKSECEYGEIQDMFAYQGRLYFVVLVAWTQKEPAEKGDRKGKLVSVDYERTILLSADEKDIANLRHESAVTDYLRENVKTEQSESRLVFRRFEKADIRGTADGRAILLYLDDEKGETVMASYDLETGEITEYQKNKERKK